MVKKILVTIGILVVVAVAAALILGNRIAHRALPEYSKPFVIKNLHDSVWVYRDSFAMPHVYARNESDLYRVAGYLVAQDRLWQMDLLRHVTEGRLSEIFGSDLINADILMRSLRIPEKSGKLYQETLPEIKEAFEAYCDGINQYMEAHKDKLPPEFALIGYKPEPWKPEHSFNLVGYMAWDLNGSWIAEIVLHKIKNRLGREKALELVPYFDPAQEVIFPGTVAADKRVEWGSEMIAAARRIQDLGVSVFHGSNNWAVNSTRSSNGRPILANDMHLGLMAPGIWYQMHQVVEGKVNVTGVMLPGAPFIISGHNEAVAWGMTNVMNDDIDFYLEKINPADSSQYMFEGSWKPLLIKQEKIPVKGSDTVTGVLRFTHRGPVISDLKGLDNETVSMRWLGNEWSNEIRTVYLLNRVKNWDDFKEAIRSFVSVSQNIVYADTAGNIGLYCSAGVPLRKGPAWEVLPGETSEFDWKGLVPFESLPNYYNPESGIAVSANNKTAPGDYPYYISYWYDLPFRYNRIYNMLAENSKHTSGSFKTIQTDFYSENVKFYLPSLLGTLEKSSTDSVYKEAFELLKQWNYIMDSESAPAAIYEMFFMKFIRNLLVDELGEELYNEFVSDKILVRQAIHRAWTTGTSFIDDVNTSQEEMFADMVLKSYREAVADLAGRFGKNAAGWKWGDLHQVSVNHPMGSVKILNRLLNWNRGPFRAGGSFHTVEPFSYKYTRPFESTHGASQRHIYVTGNWDESWNIIPTGISGIPASEHYCDQTQLYMDKKYRRDWFSREAVIKNARYRIVLSPE